MNQTKIESFIERLVDVGTGFVISVMLYKYFILPNEWLWSNAILVTGIFTVVSIARGYVWRRFFNAGLHRAVHNFVRKVR